MSEPRLESPLCMSALIDVIVPCYRYGHYLRQCVESALAQAEPVRVLIIDDASPDDSAEVAADLAASDARVALMRHRANKGHIATYNEGIEWATSPYLLLLSADDYLLPGALTRAVRVMEMHPEVGLVFGNAFELVEKGTMIPVEPFAAAGPRVKDCIMTGQEFVTRSGARNIVPTPTAVVRTSIQKSVGGYRSDLPHSGDMEMWLRICVCASVGFVDAYQAVYRLHGGNMSNGYREANWLPDILQRKAAIDCFLENSAAVPWLERGLRARIRYSLAVDTVSHASRAFNDGDLELFGQLSELAVSLCPQVARSWPWTKLMCKQLMGRRVWRLLDAVRH
jgi:glycosyltransferase involved in cell wall biosynthesis